MSTLFVNNLNTASGSTITIPTGKQLVGTDSNSIKAPDMVVQYQHTTLASGSSLSTATAWTDTGNQLTITPKYNNSKIFVCFSHVMRIGYGVSHTRADLRVLVTGDVSDEAWRTYYVGEESQDAGKDPINNYGGSFTYTVASTAAKTFKLQFRKAEANANQAGNIYYKWYTGSIHTMTAMEIAQ